MGQSSVFGAAPAPPGGRKLPLIGNTLSDDEKIEALNNLGLSVGTGFTGVTLPDSGDLAASGTNQTFEILSVEGYTIATGIQLLSIGVGGGAIDIVTAITRLTTTAAGALTLANGANGQLKEVFFVSDGGDATLTPTTKTGYSTIVFNDVGDSVVLRYLTTVGWMVRSNNGCTIS